MVLALATVTNYTKQNLEPVIKIQHCNCQNIKIASGNIFEFMKKLFTLNFELNPKVNIIWCFVTLANPPPPRDLITIALFMVYYITHYCSEGGGAL